MVNGEYKNHYFLKGKTWEMFWIIWKKWNVTRYPKRGSI